MTEAGMDEHLDDNEALVAVYDLVAQLLCARDEIAWHPDVDGFNDTDADARYLEAAGIVDHLVAQGPPQPLAGPLVRRGHHLRMLTERRTP